MATSLPPEQPGTSTQNTQNNNTEDPPNWALALAQNAENDRIRRENEELKARLQQQQVQTQTPLPQLQPGEPFQDPNKFVNVLEQMVNRQVAPLQAELEASKRDRAYQALKLQIKAANPQLVQVFGQIENAVDIEMQGKEPTHQNLVNSIRMVIGSLALSNPGAFAPRTANPAPAPNNPPPANPSGQVPIVQTPPHLAPSNRAPDSGDANNKPVDLSQFDENERRLMREKGLTPRQFIALRDTPNHLMTKELYNKIKNDPEYKKP